MNQSTNINGDLYGGALGFLTTLRILIRTFKPKRVYVAWEQGGACQRRKRIFSEYKANRVKQKDFDGLYKNDRDALLSDTRNKAQQLQVLTKALGQLPIVQLYVPDCEGDDVVAYLVKRKLSQEKGLKVIASADKDFYQLLEDPTVRIYSPMKKTLINAQDVIDEYGIAPRNFCLARTLVGDVSDNIDGVQGVGLKTAAKRFPILADVSQDYLPGDMESYAVQQIKELGKKAPKCYQDVIDNMDTVKRNWQLMYLDTHNFAASQIQKIDTKVDGFSPVINNIEYLKAFAAAQIPITKDMSDMVQELRYLTISS